MPPGPWLYPEDQISDAPLRLLAAEITREKIYRAPARRTALSLDGRDRTAGKEQPDGSVRIEQTIYVERESQRKIVLGEGGRTIKAIGQRRRARRSPRSPRRKVHLFLFVKVRENWVDDPERYREMGLDFPKG